MFSIRSTTKFIEAFVLCVDDCADAQTIDTNIISEDEHVNPYSVQILVDLARLKRSKF